MIKEKILRIHTFLSKINPVAFIIAITIATYIVLIPLLPVFELLNSIEGPIGGIEVSQKDGWLYNIVLLVILAPLIETAVFQFFLIEFVLFLVPHKKVLAVLISATIFSISHSYSIQYVLFSFAIGFLLAYSYIIYRQDKAFLIVFLIHALRNFLGLLLFFYL